MTTSAGLAQHHTALPIAANDNQVQPDRPATAWPTGKRLTRAKRHADLVMLKTYRELVDVAYGTASNDNYRNPPPARGTADTRAASEVITQIDHAMKEDGIIPTIMQMHDLSAVPWGDDDGFDPKSPARPVVTDTDRGGVTRREMGGMVFIYGAHLWEYRADPEARPKKPMELRARHRNKAGSVQSLIPNSSGMWSIEEQIDARQTLRSIYEKLPASSVKIIELALGSTKAEDIGVVFRKTGKAAERFGVRLIDRAIDHLREVWPSLKPI